MAKVRIPTPLRTFTHNQEEVAAAGDTVRDVVKDLERQFPGLGARILDEKGAVRRYVNIFHNDEDIRFLKDLGTEVVEADRITIIPAIAGG